MKLVDFRDRTTKIGFYDDDYVVETQRINIQGFHEKRYLNEEKIVHLNEMILVDQYLVSECDFILRLMKTFMNLNTTRLV